MLLSEEDTRIMLVGKEKSLSCEIFLSSVALFLIFSLHFLPPPSQGSANLIYSLASLSWLSLLAVYILYDKICRAERERVRERERKKTSTALGVAAAKLLSFGLAPIEYRTAKRERERERKKNKSMGAGFFFSLARIERKRERKRVSINIFPSPSCSLLQQKREKKILDGWNLIRETFQDEKEKVGNPMRKWGENV